MKQHAALLLSTAVLLAHCGPAFSGEAPPGHWDLQIVNGTLIKAQGASVPATLQNVVDYLVELQPANVVLAPKLGRITVDNLKLAGLKWESVLEALRIASGSQFIWNSQAAMSEIDPNTGMPVRLPSPGDPGLYILQADPAGVARLSERAVEVFNLGGYLAGKDANQVAEALKEMQQILGESLDQLGAVGGATQTDPSPSVRFHSNANLLVVVGTPQQLDVARKIVLALPGTAPSQAAAGESQIDGNAFFGGMDPVLRQRYGLMHSGPAQPGGGYPRSTTRSPGATQPRSAVPGGVGTTSPVPAPNTAQPGAVAPPTPAE